MTTGVPMHKILDSVNSPADLRTMTSDELTALAGDIRQLIIDTISRTGGHIAASLGVVELTIALHHVFDTPDDKIVWDVGHQAYAHKILTGRKDLFHTIRQHGGLSGFPKRMESMYDTFDAGHSSTSISAALGIAQASSMQGSGRKVIAVIGDGSMTAGMAFEGLNHAGHIKRDLIVILNDNEMSISPNVGALSSVLSRIISGQSYNRFREEIKGLIEKIPGIGDSVYRIVRQSEEFFKSLFVKGFFFEELGFTYLGPIIGHNLDHLIENLKNIKDLSGPILLHVVTKKGHGYTPAEQDPTRFHGIGAFDRTTGKSLSTAGPISYTDVFGKALTEIAARHPEVVAITAGMTTGTGLPVFAQTFPERFFDVGIAEQHAITFAAGLATQGLRPFAAIYSTFLQRAYDQILHDVCMQNLPVVFILDRAGIVGEDGPTHHGLFDISYLRPMPNMVFMAPKDEHELQQMLYTALQLSQPVAIRYARGAGTGVALDREITCIDVGRAEILCEGAQVAIIAIGSMVHPAREAAGILAAEGISCAVINSRFIKPLDEAVILEYARRGIPLVTAEENVLQGGFGSAVLEVLHRNRCIVPVISVGIPDTFVEHGTQKQLRSHYGLDATGLCTTVRTLIKGVPGAGDAFQKTAIG
jgi:1-deoxy-D-xylulose-5-phosphate synthase